MAVQAGRRRVSQGRGCGDRYTGGGVRPGCGGGAACPKCHGPPDRVGLLCAPQKRARAVPVSMRGCGATVGACRGLESSHLSTPRQRVRPSRPRRWRNGRGSPGRSRICRVRSSSCRTETERSCRGIAAELGRRCTARPRRGSSSRRRDTRPTERQGKSILVCCIWFACICAHRTQLRSSTSGPCAAVP